MNERSSVTRRSGMIRREWWLVTPQGFMASNSGCTDVLVDGASTANLARWPCESVTALECHRLFRRRGNEPRRVRPEAQGPDRPVERADGEVGGAVAGGEEQVPAAARRSAGAPRGGACRAAAHPGRLGGRVGSNDARRGRRLQGDARGVRARAQGVREEMIVGRGFAFEDLKVGMRFRTHRRTILEADLAAFINLTGLTEELFSVVEANRKPLVPGALVYSFAEGLLLPTMQDTGLAFLNATLDIKGPTHVGDTIRVECEVTEARLASKGDRGLVRFANKVVKQDDQVVLEYNPLRLLKKK